MMFRREGTRELLLGRIGARQNIYDTGTKGRSPSKEAFVRVRTGMREFIYLESDSSSPKDSTLTDGDSHTSCPPSRIPFPHINHIID